MGSACHISPDPWYTDSYACFPATGWPIRPCLMTIHCGAIPNQRRSERAHASTPATGNALALAAIDCPLKRLNGETIDEDTNSWPLKSTSNHHAVFGTGAGIDETCLAATGRKRRNPSHFHSDACRGPSTAADPGRPVATYSAAFFSNYDLF